MIWCRYKKIAFVSGVRASYFSCFIFFCWFYIQFSFFFFLLALQIGNWCVSWKLYENFGTRNCPNKIWNIIKSELLKSNDFAHARPISTHPRSEVDGTQHELYSIHKLVFFSSRFSFNNSNHSLLCICIYWKKKTKNFISFP